MLQQAPGNTHSETITGFLSEKNRIMAEGMCCASIVDAVTGGVSGFFSSQVSHWHLGEITGIDLGR